MGVARYLRGIGIAFFVLLSGCAHAPVMGGASGANQGAKAAVVAVDGAEPAPRFNISYLDLPSGEHLFLHQAGLVAVTPGVLPRKQGWLPRVDFLGGAWSIPPGAMFENLPGTDLHARGVLVHPDGRFFLSVSGPDGEEKGEEESQNEWVAAYTKEGKPNPAFGARIKRFPAPRMSGILFRVGKRVVRLQAKALQVNPAHPDQGGLLLAGWYEDPRFVDLYSDPRLPRHYKQKDVVQLREKRRKEKRFTILVLRRFHLDGKPDLRFGNQGIVIIDRKEKPDNTEITGLQASDNAIYVSYSLNRYRSDRCEEEHDPEENIVVSYTTAGQLRDGRNGPEFGQKGRIRLTGPTKKPIYVRTFRVEQDRLFLAGHYNDEGSCGEKTEETTSTEHVIWWHYDENGNPSASFGEHGFVVQKFSTKSLPWITHLVAHQGRLYTIIEASSDKRNFPKDGYADRIEQAILDENRKTLVMLCRDQNHGGPCLGWGPEGRRDVPFHHLESIEDARVYEKGELYSQNPSLWILVKRSFPGNAPLEGAAILRLPLAR